MQPTHMMPIFSCSQSVLQLLRMPKGLPDFGNHVFRLWISCNYSSSLLGHQCLHFFAHAERLAHSNWLNICQTVQCELTFLLRMPKGLPVGLSQLFLEVNLEISLETSGAIIPPVHCSSLRMPKGLLTLIVSTFRLLTFSMFEHFQLSLINLPSING
jgi:hypothetical protein